MVERIREKIVNYNRFAHCLIILMAEMVKSTFMNNRLFGFSHKLLLYNFLLLTIARQRILSIYFQDWKQRWNWASNQKSFELHTWRLLFVIETNGNLNYFNNLHSNDFNQVISDRFWNESWISHIFDNVKNICKIYR